jgi:insulysin
VVVISDPLTDLSGASMNVAAGSFNDPSDFEGLAHFCEHMLFLGTVTHPQENLYSNFVSSHGGYDNAYTSTQETNFQFRVNSDYLQTPLDMFAHFFIDPLLSEESTADEMFAVNQEHEKNLHYDPYKLWQLLKEVSNPDHPFHQFSTGNFDTLNKTGVNEQLQEYYHRNYVADNVSGWSHEIMGGVLGGWSHGWARSWGG